MLDLTQGRMARRIAPVILLVGLAACSKQEEKPAATAGTTPAAPATAPAPTAATAVSPQVQSMAADQLRESATKSILICLPLESCTPISRRLPLSS